MQKSKLLNKFYLKPNEQTRKIVVVNVGLLLQKWYIIQGEEKWRTRILSRKVMTNLKIKMSLAKYRQVRMCIGNKHKRRKH